MRKLKKLFPALMVIVLLAIMVPVAAPQEVEAAVPYPATITYNLFATDGFMKLADGNSLYSYGYIGGVAGAPLTYLDYNGNPVVVPGGVPNPTPGPLVPGSVEASLAGHAQSPGPLITARIGDTVIINLKNLGVTNNNAAGNDPHTVHLHAVDVGAANDGVPETSVAAIPAGPLNSAAFPLAPGAGNIVVYQFTTTFPGTYMYHCHQEADIHVTMGMWGVIIFYNPYDPAFATGPGPTSTGGQLFGHKYDKDYVMLLTETDVRQHLSEQGSATGTVTDTVFGTGFTAPTGAFNPVAYQPQYWFVNGLSFPDTVHASAGNNWTNWIAAHPGMDPMIVGSLGATSPTKKPQKILLRMVNLGYETQPMHMHGYHAKVIGFDQRPWTWANPPGMPTGKGLEQNTILIGSGNTYELLIDIGAQAVASTYPVGSQSRYDAATNLPVANTQTASPAIVGGGGFPYIGGPTVKGVGDMLPSDATNPYNPVTFPSQIFVFHNHDDYKATNNGVYPGGAFTVIVPTP